MSANKKRRVVVTGVGAVTPLGNDWEATWRGLLNVEVRARAIQRFDAKLFPCNFAYEVDGFQPSISGAKFAPSLNRAGEFGFAAAEEALKMAGLWGIPAPSPLGVCLGVGIGCPDLDWFADVYIPKKFDDPSLKVHDRHFPHTLTAVLANAVAARGPVQTVHTACASSGQSLGEAFEMVAYGDSDIVLTGGADSMINATHVAGFCLLGALSKQTANPKVASRPFDMGRDGFVLGEGAAMLVFEALDSAVARGAKIFGEVCGYGITASAYRITDLHPEGTGPKEAMQMALDDAGITQADVGYINAHGTSTALNDRIEALAISKIFDKRSVAVSSSKSMTGHLISAAGALEFAISLRSVMEGVLLPSVNLFEQDPACDIRLTGPQPEMHTFDYALSNSIGFGGSNTALIARRFRSEETAYVPS